MTRRLILGNYGTGAVGMKVSLPGYDAATADDSDPAKFSFNSEWSQDLAQVHKTGRAHIGQSVAHTLGFYPFCEAAYRDPSNGAISKMFKVVAATGGLDTSYRPYTLCVTSNYIAAHLWWADAAAWDGTSGPAIVSTWGPLMGDAYYDYIIWNVQAY